jgi:hypothetical protein
MTYTESLQWLENELINFPERASGEDLYAHIKKLVARRLGIERADLLCALSHWLDLRSEPRTTLAMDLIADFKLFELEPRLIELLRVVQEGAAFKPYYSQFVTKALERLKERNSSRSPVRSVP